jgi:hypothetical protein
MQPITQPAPAARVKSSFLTQLDEDDDEIDLDADYKANYENSPPSPTPSYTSLKTKDTLDIRSDSDDVGRRNALNSATPISAASPIFSSSPIPSHTPLVKKIDSIPLQSTPSSIGKDKVLEEPKIANKLNVISQITPIKSVTTPSTPTTLSTPLSTPLSTFTPGTPVASATPSSPFFKLQSTPSYNQKGTPADSLHNLQNIIIRDNTKNSTTKPDPLASPTAGLPPLRQATSGKPEVRKQLDMDAAVGPKLDRRDLDPPTTDNLQDNKPGTKNSATKPPVHILTLISEKESESKAISGKKDPANLLGQSPLKKSTPSPPPYSSSFCSTFSFPPTLHAHIISILAGFTYDDADIQDIQELAGDFVDHETGIFILYIFYYF